jgi:hypothetical protein
VAPAGVVVALRGVIAPGGGILAVAALDTAAALAISSANAYAAPQAARPLAARPRKLRRGAFALRRAPPPARGGVSIATA